jgi:hypothetical protein
MATLINAITAFRPRIVQGKPVSEEQYLELMTQRSALSAGIIKNVQECEMETVIALLRKGRPIHTGSAIYTLNITLDGSYEVNVKLKKRMAQALNKPGAFRGKIANAENIGKTSGKLADMWDAKHPNDLVDR